MNPQIVIKKEESYATGLTNKAGSMSGSIPGGGRQRRRETSGDVPLRAEMTSYGHIWFSIRQSHQDVQDYHSMSYATKTDNKDH